MKVRGNFQIRRDFNIVRKVSSRFFREAFIYFEMSFEDLADFNNNLRVRGNYLKVKGLFSLETISSKDLTLFHKFPPVAY